MVPPPGAPDRVATVAAEHEPYLLSGTEVYVHYSRGIGRSKLAQEFSKIVGVSATVRNLHTVGKVVDPARPLSRRSHLTRSPHGRGREGDGDIS